jgi:hypothetical protein
MDGPRPPTLYPHQGEPLERGDEIMARASDLPALWNRRGVVRDRRREDRSSAHRVGDKADALASVIRYVLYLTFAFLTFQGFTLAAYFVDAKFLFSENGPAEWFQFSLLLACCASLEAAGRRSRSRRDLFRLMTIPFLIAAVREMDANFDRRLFDGAWEGMAGMLVLSGALLYWYRGKQIREQFQSILISRSGGLLLAGALTFAVFAPMLGQQRFWRLALGEQYVRLAGRIIEESGELLGYLFLLFGCIEMLVSSPPDLKDESHF